MKFIKVCLFLFSLATTEAMAQTSQDAKMDRFISGLMKKMTPDEKLGQLNLPGAGDITTGQASSAGIAQKIKEGKVGGCQFFITTKTPADRCRKGNGFRNSVPII